MCQKNTREYRGVAQNAVVKISLHLQIYQTQHWTIPIFSASKTPTGLKHSGVGNRIASGSLVGFGTANLRDTVTSQASLKS